MHLTRFEHGGNIYFNDNSGKIRLPLLDFSANINPSGLSPRGLKALENWQEMIIHYPDVKYNNLFNALEKEYNFSREWITLGNGVTELLYLLLKLLQPKQVLLTAPTFSEYERAALSVNAEIIRYFPPEEQNFSLSVDIIDKFIAKIPTKGLVVLGHPNNPDGNILTVEIFHKILNAVKMKNSILLLDEAFIDFLGRKYSFREEIKKHKNLIILQSLTKFYAIPGLRIGCCFAEKDITIALKNQKDPWNINVLAANYMTAAFADDAFKRNSYDFVKTEKEFIYNELASFKSIEPLPPSVNFILCKLAKESGSVEKLQQTLLSFHILIRNCNNFWGLNEQYFRLAVRTHSENKLLINNLRMVLT